MLVLDHAIALTLYIGRLINRDVELTLREIIITAQETINWSQIVTGCVPQPMDDDVG